MISLIISSVSLLIEERDFISSASCGIFIDYFRNWGAIKKALTILYTIEPLPEVNMVLFLRNKWYNVALFLSDYQYEVVEFTNWGARMPQNMFGWQWLLIKDFCTPPLGKQIESNFFVVIFRAKAKFVNIKRGIKHLKSLVFLHICLDLS